MATTLEQVKASISELSAEDREQLIQDLLDETDSDNATDEEEISKIVKAPGRASR